MHRDQQALRDFAQRTRWGVYLHLPLWLLMCSFVGLANTAPWIFWINCAGFVGATGLRILFFRRPVAMLAAHTETARTIMLILIFIPCLQWSYLAVLSAQNGFLHPLLEPLILVMVGLATAGAVVLSIDNIARFWYPIIALVPIGIAHLLYQPGPVNILLAIMNVSVILYIGMGTRLVHQDYWTALRARGLLEERAKMLEWLSTTDGLTQISNRLHFERCLSEAWTLATRQRCPLSILLIDLDHFKKINDTHGHAIGDECLKAAAQAMVNGMLRATDQVARWGGEEFIVLLQNADRDVADAVAQRLLKAVANTSIPYPGGIVRLACSIGVATMNPNDRCNPANLINDADKALYAAKSTGRNRVVASAA